MRKTTRVSVWVRAGAGGFQVIWLWVGFVLFILVMLGLDLFVVNRSPHVVRAREAALWTGVCIVLALLFTGAVYWIYSSNWLGIGTSFIENHAPDADLSAAAPQHQVGLRAAVEFLTGWLVEYSLSLDNIFIIAVIFTHFRVPLKHQHRVLFWGILGALIMRGLMIGAGAALIGLSDWMVFLFGGLVLFAAVKLLLQKESEFDPERSWIVRLTRRVVPVTAGFRESRFIVRENGVLAITPLLLVLLVVESMDVVFAVDSIPAIFAVTRDPFLVFTSNVFAILGLRSLYFVLAVLLDRFEHLKYSLAFILGYVGVKMVLNGFHVEVNDWVSLAVICGSLGVGIGVSPLRAGRRTPASHDSEANA
jgi:tellurite resistance protein TerC